MTKQEKIKLLKTDVTAWNKWKEENPGEVDLYKDNLRGANLIKANLRGANLIKANLSEANLYKAHLSGADLRGANLRRANLSWANLSLANLFRANLSLANLFRANLYWANLSEANLYKANLPAPSMVLLANWGEVSDELCVDLMRYDAFFHDNPEEFITWSKGGPCPYDDCKFQRACNFREKRDLYTPGPVKNGFALMVALFKEKCENSDYHDESTVEK